MDDSAYGLWFLVLINSAIFIIFAVSFFHPRIVGLLTGVAAFIGAFMNMSFLLAGSASTNPVMFTLAIGLILAWRVAGSYGLDRYLLPRLGTPWRPGVLATRRPQQPPGSRVG